MQIVMKVVNMKNIRTNLLTYTHTYILNLDIRRQLFRTEFTLTELTLHSLWLHVSLLCRVGRDDYFLCLCAHNGSKYLRGIR